MDIKKPPFHAKRREQRRTRAGKALRVDEKSAAARKICMHTPRAKRRRCLPVSASYLRILSSLSLFLHIIYHVFGGMSRLFSMDGKLYGFFCVRPADVQ